MASSSPVGDVAPARSVLKFVKLTDNAYTPTKASEFSAGYDLHSAYACVIPAYGKAVLPTDLKVRVPSDTYGRVAPRSDLAVSAHIGVGAGVIDEDYTGNLGVVLFNHAATEFTVRKGDRIAQLICEKLVYPVLEEVKSLEATTGEDVVGGSSQSQSY